MLKKHFAVAIDGPAGVGKTTMAKMIAESLGIVYVDTGKMFRAIAYAVLKVYGKDETALVDADWLEGVVTKMSLAYDGTDTIITIASTVAGRETITKRVPDDELRTEEISFAASTVSKLPVVREALLKFQREMAKNNDVVMEGRDIGTVVLPDANVKFYLIADAEVRASRRVKQLAEKGEEADFDTVLQQMLLRDKQDSERDVAPLRAADDAIIMNSTHSSKDDVLDTMLRRIKTDKGFFETAFNEAYMADFCTMDKDDFIKAHDEFESWRTYDALAKIYSRRGDDTADPDNGLFRVWWIPQLGAVEPFIIPVKTTEEAAKTLALLASYDLYQLDNHIKPDFSNAGGLEVFEDGEWCDWTMCAGDAFYDDFDDYVESEDFPNREVQAVYLKALMRQTGDAE